MLYTLSRADEGNLHAILSQLTEQDALLLWQDGVLQAVKNPQLFANLPHFFILENDLVARGLRSSYPTLSLQDLVTLTEKFYPQVAL